MAKTKATKDSYTEVEPIWTTVMNNGGTTVITKTKEEATNLIQRIHQYRVLDRKDSFDGKSSMLDQYIVKRLSETKIVIQRRVIEYELFTPEGEKVDILKLQRELEEERQTNVDRLFDPDGPLGLV